MIDNVRPDRQTVMFSATFPRQMEALARRILTKPVEIQVGGRSVVCKDVEQYVVSNHIECVLVTRDVVLGTRTRTRVQLKYKFEVLVLVLVVGVLVYYATLLIGSALYTVYLLLSTF